MEEGGAVRMASSARAHARTRLLTDVQRERERRHTHTHTKREKPRYGDSSAPDREKERDSNMSVHTRYYLCIGLVSLLEVIEELLYLLEVLVRLDLLRPTCTCIPIQRKNYHQ